MELEVELRGFLAKSIIGKRNILAPGVTASLELMKYLLTLPRRLWPDVDFLDSSCELLIGIVSFLGVIPCGLGTKREVSFIMLSIRSSLPPLHLLRSLSSVSASDDPLLILCRIVFFDDPNSSPEMLALLARLLESCLLGFLSLAVFKWEWCFGTGGTGGICWSAIESFAAAAKTSLSDRWLLVGFSGRAWVLASFEILDRLALGVTAFFLVPEDVNLAGKLVRPSNCFGFRSLLRLNLRFTLLIMLAVKVWSVLLDDFRRLSLDVFGLEEMRGGRGTICGALISSLICLTFTFGRLGGSSTVVSAGGGGGDLSTRDLDLVVVLVKDMERFGSISRACCSIVLSLVERNDFAFGLKLFPRFFISASCADCRRLLFSLFIGPAGCWSSQFCAAETVAIKSDESGPILSKLGDDGALWFLKAGL